MKDLASASGMPASVVAVSSVSSEDGCFSFSKYCEYRATRGQHIPPALVVQLTVDQLVDRLGPLLLLKVLNYAMGIHRIGDTIQSVTFLSGILSCLICHVCPHDGLLFITDLPTGGDLRAAKFVIDPSTDAVCFHQCLIHLHLLVAVCIARLAVPRIFVLALF